MLTSPEALGAYAEGIRSAWSSFLLGAEDELAARDPVVSSPRGEVTFTELLASQLWHVEFHYRELREFLGGGRVRP